MWCGDLDTYTASDLPDFHCFVKQCLFVLTALMPNNAFCCCPTSMYVTPHPVIDFELNIAQHLKAGSPVLSNSMSAFAYNSKLFVPSFAAKHHTRPIPIQTCNTCTCIKRPLHSTLTLRRFIHQDIYSKGQRLAPELSQHFQIPQHLLSDVYRRSNGFFSSKELLGGDGSLNSYRERHRGPATKAILIAC